MNTSSLTSSLAMLVAAGWLVDGAAGPAQKTPNDSVQVEEYYDYNFLQRLTLSTAYLGNPALASSAEIRYFVPLEASSPEEQKKLDDLVKDGNAQYGVRAENGERVYGILDEALPGVQSKGLILDEDGLKAAGVDNRAAAQLISWGQVVDVPKEELFRQEDGLELGKEAAD